MKSDSRPASHERAYQASLHFNSLRSGDEFLIDVSITYSRAIHASTWAARPGGGLDIGNLEEALPAMRPATDLNYAASAIERLVTAIRIRLQIASVIGEKCLRMHRFA